MATRTLLVSHEPSSPEYQFCGIAEHLHSLPEHLWLTFSFWRAIAGVKDLRRVPMTFDEIEMQQDQIFMKRNSEVIQTMIITLGGYN